ncbi:MAG: DUF4388 domain-containing protein [Cystobacterineae bacterium]|nr:DUF4388 domain-containing protein [Cystobacterineae bacterium]
MDETLHHESLQTQTVEDAAHASAQKNPQEVGATASLKHLLKTRELALPSERERQSAMRLTEIIRQLVVQLEQNRPGVLRDHSPLVERLSLHIGNAMGMTLREISQLQLACLAHELTHPGGPHLTLSSLNADSSCALLAQQQLDNGIEFQLPPSSTSLLKQRFEAFDGSGLPRKLHAEGILLGSRILAAVDAYVDFRRSLRNPSGRILSKKDALSKLQEGNGKLFDPRVLETLQETLNSTPLRKALIQDGRWLLLASPHRERVQELRKITEPMEWTSRSSAVLDDVLDVLQDSGVAALCLDLAFGDEDIRALAEYIRLHPTSAALPIFLIGKPQNKNIAANLEQAGVDAFLPLPLDASETQKTIRTRVEHHIAMGALGQTIYGSYEEIEPAELFELLSQQKKSGALWVRTAKLQGKAFFEQGNLVFASWENKTGQQATKTMISLVHAEFKFIPNALWVAPPET